MKRFLMKNEGEQRRKTFIFSMNISKRRLGWCIGEIVLRLRCLHAKEVPLSSSTTGPQTA